MNLLSSTNKANRHRLQEIAKFSLSDKDSDTSSFVVEHSNSTYTYSFKIQPFIDIIDEELDTVYINVIFSYNYNEKIYTIQIGKYKHLLDEYMFRQLKELFYNRKYNEELDSIEDSTVNKFIDTYYTQIEAQYNKESKSAGLINVNEYDEPDAMNEARPEPNDEESGDDIDDINIQDAENENEHTNTTMW